MASAACQFSLMPPAIATATKNIFYATKQRQKCKIYYGKMQHVSGKLIIIIINIILLGKKQYRPASQIPVVYTACG